MVDLTELAGEVAARLGKEWRTETIPGPWDSVVLHGPDEMCILLGAAGEDGLRLVWFVPQAVAGEAAAGGHRHNKEIVTSMTRGPASIAAMINRRLVPQARRARHLAHYEQARRDRLLRELAGALGLPALCRVGDRIIFNDGDHDSPAIEVQLRDGGRIVDLTASLPPAWALRVAVAVGQGLADGVPTPVSDRQVRE